MTIRGTGGGASLRKKTQLIHDTIDIMLELMERHNRETGNHNNLIILFPERKQLYNSPEVVKTATNIIDYILQTGFQNKPTINEIDPYTYRRTLIDRFNILKRMNESLPFWYEINQEIGEIINSGRSEDSAWNIETSPAIQIAEAKLGSRDIPLKARDVLGIRIPTAERKNDTPLAESYQILNDTMSPSPAYVATLEAEDRIRARERREERLAREQGEAKARDDANEALARFRRERNQEQALRDAENQLWLDRKIEDREELDADLALREVLAERNRQLRIRQQEEEQKRNQEEVRKASSTGKGIIHGIRGIIRNKSGRYHRC